METVLTLESFDMPDHRIGQPSAEYQAGLNAGTLAGKAEAEAEADHLQRDVAQALSTICCTYQKARDDVMTSLAGLIDELAYAVLPHCVACGFAGQVADLISSRFTPDDRAEIQVHVHPDQVAAVTAATTLLQDRIIVKADRSLTAHAAWISQSTTEIQLDLERHLADLTALISTINIKYDEDRDNG